MTEARQLEQSEKDRIFCEETYRLEVRRQIAGDGKEDNAWTFINSPFFLWLLSSVVLGLITFLYTKWEESREERRFEAQQLSKMREATFESLSADMSTFVFCSDVLTKGFEERWWKRSGLESLVPKYNDAIFALRGKEYRYQGKVQRLWGTNAVESYSDFIEQTRVYDDVIHKVNDEIGAVTSKEKGDIDFSKVEPIVTKELRPAVEALAKKSEALLDCLTNGL